MSRRRLSFPSAFVLFFWLWIQWGGVVVCQSTTPLALNPNFIGYYLGPDGTEVLSADLPWITSATYAGDCAKGAQGRCVMATLCQDNTLFFDNGKTRDCGEEYNCVSMTIFQTFPNGLPSAINNACRGAWFAYTVYRDLATTTSPSSSDETTSPPASTNPKSAPSPPQTGTPISQPLSPPAGANTNTPPPPPQPSEPKTDKALIAGAVVGAAVGVSLIFGAFFWWWQRKAARSAGYVGNYGGEGYVYDGGYAGPPANELPMVSYKHEEMNPTEMPGIREPSELMHDRH